MNILIQEAQITPSIENIKKADYCGLSGRCVWLPFQLVARPCLVPWLPATGGRDQVLSSLVAGPQGVPGLVLAQ